MKLNFFSFKKSQGEIFGIALVFVVLIVGILVYSQVKAVSPKNSQENSIQREKYEVLASGTLDSILKMSTGCEVERGKDTIYDLIKYCEYTYNSYDEDPPIYCQDEVEEVGSCAKVIKILNTTLNGLFNNSNSQKGIGLMPYKLEIYTPDKNSIHRSNLEKNLTNFGSFVYTSSSKSVIITQNNYLRYGYNKAPSGLRTIPTSKRNVNLELSLYYKDY